LLRTFRDSLSHHHQVSIKEEGLALYMGPQAVPKRQQPTIKLQCKISLNCTATEARNLAHVFSTGGCGLAAITTRSWLWLPCLVRTVSPFRNDCFAVTDLDERSRCSTMN